VGPRIRLDIGELSFDGRLHDTPAAKALANFLPLTVRMTRWDSEFSGPILPPLGEFPEDDLTDLLAQGSLAYWEPGESLCLFPGGGDEMRAAFLMHPVGNIEGDLHLLQGLGNCLDLTISSKEDEI
jgi:hypothetical protein